MKDTCPLHQTKNIARPGQQDPIKKDGTQDIKGQLVKTVGSLNNKTIQVTNAGKDSLLPEAVVSYSPIHVGLLVDGHVSEHSSLSLRRVTGTELTLDEPRRQTAIPV
jgi:hypothetical protein